MKKCEIHDIIASAKNADKYRNGVIIINGIFLKIQDIDFSILDLIQQEIANSVLDKIFPPITHLGSYGIIWIAITLILLCIKKYRKAGIVSAAALIMSLIVCNLAIKPLAARVRPYDINTAVKLLVTAPTDYSFPSGHTSSSFAAAVSILLCGHKKIGIPTLILAVIISFSRLYLYLHYPSDVLCGMILGIIFAIASYNLVNLIMRKRALK